MALQEFLELSFARKSCGTASSQPFDLGLQFGDCLLHLTDALAYLIVRRSSRRRTCGLGGHRNQRLFFDALTYAAPRFGTVHASLLSLLETRRQWTDASGIVWRGQRSHLQRAVQVDRHVLTE